MTDLDLEKERERLDDIRGRTSHTHYDTQQKLVAALEEIERLREAQGEPCGHIRGYQKDSTVALVYMDSCEPLPPVNTELYTAPPPPSVPEGQHMNWSEQLKEARRRLDYALSLHHSPEGYMQGWSVVREAENLLKISGQALEALARVETVSTFRLMDVEPGEVLHIEKLVRYEDVQKALEGGG